MVANALAVTMVTLRHSKPTYLMMIFSPMIVNAIYDMDKAAWTCSESCGLCFFLRFGGLL